MNKQKVKPPAPQAEERAFRLAPLRVSPEQFFTNRQRSLALSKGECRLLAAILRDAVMDWFRYRNVGS